MVGRWYFAGLNANGVRPSGSHRSGPLDVRRLEPIPDLPGDNVDVLFVCWSQVVFRTRQRLIVRGFRACDVDGVAASTIVSLIGDHNGISGALAEDSKLYLSESATPNDMSTPITLRLAADDDSPRLAQVSVADNFRVAVAFKPAPAASTFHIEEFKDLAGFRKWYTDPTNPENYPCKHHQIGGKLKQLVSNSKIFIALTEKGQVFTWGDPRHGGLGRTTSEPDDQPAQQPGLLTSLDGIRIVKISAGGQTVAALSEDQAVYLWSGAEQGGNDTLTVLAGLQVDQVALVNIRDERGELYDLEDVAVGHGHVLVRTTDGRVFAAGDNRNGQLGIGSDDPFRADFVQVVAGGCTAMKAGSKSTVIYTSTLQGESRMIVPTVYGSTT